MFINIYNASEISIAMMETVYLYWFYYIIEVGIIIIKDNTTF